eukprot:766367-Hanusia_phi.AAC.3
MPSAIITTCRLAFSTWGRVRIDSPSSWESSRSGAPPPTRRGCDNRRLQTLQEPQTTAAIPPASPCCSVGSVEKRAILDIGEGGNGIVGVAEVG